MFTASGLDNGQMVVDFGLLKGTVRDVVDSFDHAYSLWNKENDDFQDFIKSHSERYIVMPVSPTAEMYAIMFFAIIRAVILNTEFCNGENNVRLHSVRVHETDTGWAEAFEEDYLKQWRIKYCLNDIIFSDGIKKEWKDPLMWEKVLIPHDHKPFVNPKVELKYNI